jgi:hypothetical protein
MSASGTVAGTAAPAPAGPRQHQNAYAVHVGRVCPSVVFLAVGLGLRVMTVVQVGAGGWLGGVGVGRGWFETLPSSQTDRPLQVCRPLESPQALVFAISVIQFIQFIQFPAGAGVRDQRHCGGGA